MVIAIPQLTGTAFVNNLQDKIPQDWLSAFVLKNEKQLNVSSYEIPNTIKVIKIIGSNDHPNSLGHSFLFICEKKEKSSLSSDALEALNITQNADTLIIKNNRPYNQSLTLDLDPKIKTLIIDNLKNGIIHPTNNVKIDLVIQDQSGITFEGNDNQAINTILVKEQSTLNLTKCCILPTMNLEIDNSMVFIDPENKIDSLKANLIGKSNIKLVDNNRPNTHKTDNSIGNNKTKSLSKDSQINIYPTGNLKYYNINQ